MKCLYCDTAIIQWVHQQTEQPDIVQEPIFDASILFFRTFQMMNKIVTLQSLQITSDVYRFFPSK